MQIFAFRKIQKKLQRMQQNLAKIIGLVLQVKYKLEINPTFPVSAT